MARLSDEEIEERWSGLEGWERDGDAIRRTFENAFELAGCIDRLA
jgi:pterin-4a-carbinolamine dehydratase